LTWRAISVGATVAGCAAMTAPNTTVVNNDLIRPSAAHRRNLSASLKRREIAGAMSRRARIRTTAPRTVACDRTTGERRSDHSLHRQAECTGSG